MSFFTKLKGKLWLILNLFKVNLKVSLLSLIGLIIALSLVSGSLIYLDSTEADKYLYTFEEVQQNQNGLYLEFSAWGGGSDYDPAAVIQELKGYNLEEYGMADLWQQQPYSPSLGMEVTISDDYEVTHVETLGLDINTNLTSDLISNCIPGSSIPSQWNETLLYSSNIQYNISDQFNITIDKYDRIEDKVELHNITMTITGIMTPESINKSSRFYQDVYKQYYQFSQYGYEYGPDFCLVSSLDNTLVLNEEIQKVFAEPGSFYSGIELEMKYKFVGTITKDNAKDMAARLIAFYDDFQEQQYNGEPHDHYIYLYMPFLWQLRMLQNINSVMFLLFMLLSLPAFTIAIILITFSMGFINEKRKKTLTLLKMRSFTSRFIFFNLLVETLIVGILASLICIILGIPLAILMDQTMGFLNFSKNSLLTSLDKLVLKWGTLRFIFINGIIFTFLSEIRSIIRISKYSLVEMAEEASKKEDKKKKGRIRANLDIVVFLYGAGGIVFLIILIRLLRQEAYQIIAPIMVLLAPLIYIIILTSPLAFLIGIVMFLNRFLPILIRKSGNYFWNKDVKSLAVATRNLIVNKKLTSRTTLLIALSISFLMILSSLPLSFYDYSISNIQYQNGADLVMDVDFESPETLANLTKTLNKVEGLAATSIVATNYNWNEDRIGRRWFYLGIDQNYTNTIYWKNSYAQQSLPKLNESLFTMEANEGIYPFIMDASTASKLTLSVGDEFSIQYSQTSIVKGKLAGTASHWPRFFESWSEDESFVITPRKYLYNISQEFSGGLGNTNLEIYSKIKTGTNRTHVANITKVIYLNSTAGDLDDFRFIDDRYPDPQDPFDNFVFIYTNFNFISVMSVIMSVIVIFTITRRINYLTEIGLARALGMKFRQVFLLMFTEPLLLFLYSGVPGAITAMVVLNSILLIFEPLLLSGPPFILKYNLPTVVLIYSILLVVTLIAGLFNSLLAKRADISKILKEE